MKEILKGVVIISFCIFISAGTLQASIEELVSIENQVCFVDPLPDDVVDQSQYDWSNNLYQICGSQSIAQSFRPSLSPLTRIRLLLNVNSTMNAYAVFVHIEDIYMNRLGATSKKLSDIPNGLHWVEFDFEPDVYLNAGETYIIVCSSYCDCGSSLGLGYGINTDYTNGVLYIGHQPIVNQDICFETYGIEESLDSDLECTGNLFWSDIEPGDTVEGTFDISNIGDSGSKLNWKIEEKPSWGTWIFTPEEGSNLSPSEGSVQVKVFVAAPDVQEAEFSGLVKIVNKDNSDDYCEIPVVLKTPKNRELVRYHFYYLLEFFKISRISMLNSLPNQSILL